MWQFWIVPLPDGDPYRRLLDRVERGTHLADLVRAEGQRRRLGGDVDRLAPAQPLHHPRQPDVGQLPRRVAQPFELADQRPGGGDRHDDRGDDREQAQPAGQQQAHDDPDGRRRRLRDDPLPAGQLQPAQLPDQRYRDGVPARRVHHRRRSAGPPQDHPVLQVAEPDRVRAGLYPPVVGVVGR